MKYCITRKTTKRYWRITAGPLRNQYVHRVVAAALLGRPLERDEEVHHKDGCKLNIWFTNLLVLGGQDHGWVSAKQAWYMRELDIKAKADWDAFMATENKRFDSEVQAAKDAGVPWKNIDGHMAERFEEWQVGK